MTNTEKPVRRFLNRRPSVSANVPFSEDSSTKRWPVPNAVQFEASYRHWIEQIATRLPGPASELRDLLSRVTAANSEFDLVKREERERCEAANEDARQANLEIQSEIELMQSEIDQIRSRYKPEISRMKDRLDRSKTLEAVQRAHMGELPIAETGEDDRLYEEAMADEESESVPAKESDTEMRPEVSAMVAQTPQNDSERHSAPRVAPQPSAAELPTATNNPSGLEKDDPLPSSIEPSVDEARVAATARAKSELQIASELGITFETPATKFVTSNFYQFIEFMATVVCGFLFGLSIKSLLGKDGIRIFPISNRLAVTSVLAVIGIFVFVLMGFFLKAVAAKLSQTIALIHLNAVAEEGAASRMRLQRWLAWSIGIILFTASIALTFMEATVEGKGLLKPFFEAAERKAAWTGALAPGSNPGDSGSGSTTNALTIWDQWALMLTICLPYVLVQLRSGWITGWAETIKLYVGQLRQADIHSRFLKLLEERETLLQDRNIDLKQHHEEATRLRSRRVLEDLESQLRRQTRASFAYPLAAGNAPTLRDRSASQELLDPPSGNHWSEAGSSRGDEEEWTLSRFHGESADEDSRRSEFELEKLERAPEGISLGPDGDYVAIGESVYADGSPMAIAAAAAQVRQLRGRLKSLYAERKAEIQRRKSRISELKSEMQREIPVLDEDAKKRIDQQHARRAHASDVFKRHFDRTKTRWERITGQSIGCRLYRVFVDNPQ